MNPMLGAPRVIRGFAERCPKFTGWSLIHQKISKAQKRSNKVKPHCKIMLIYPSSFFPIAIIRFPVHIDTPILWSQTSDESSNTTAVTPGLVYFWTGEGMIFPSDVNTLKSQPLLGSFIRIRYTCKITTSSNILFLWTTKGSPWSDGPNISEDLRSIDRSFYTTLSVQSCRRGLPLLPCPSGEVEDEVVWSWRVVWCCRFAGKTFADMRHFFLVRSSPNFGRSFGGLHRLLKPMII